mmetsp:Transcript_14205/g.48127  ORF Transcript_14205/g.48127 Transcript_14205/m.48127 type:complete len:246 (-) Transcript_14205:207-944(-)
MRDRTSGTGGAVDMRGPGPMALGRPTSPTDTEGGAWMAASSAAEKRAFMWLISRSSRAWAPCDSESIAARECARASDAARARSRSTTRAWRAADVSCGEGLRPTGDGRAHGAWGMPSACGPLLAPDPGGCGQGHCRLSRASLCAPGLSWRPASMSPESTPSAREEPNPAGGTGGRGIVPWAGARRSSARPTPRDCGWPGAASGGGRPLGTVCTGAAGGEGVAAAATVGGGALLGGACGLPVRGSA